MKKYIITSLVMAALAATSLSAGIEYGPSIKHVLGSTSASYGATVQNEMISGSLYLRNESVDANGGTAKATDKSMTLGVDVNLPLMR
jgi:hypothetical protein